jgi:hypothetical protein
MAKRKQSTFERLRNGKLQWNRKQRRELEHRLNSADPGLEIIHPHAAGIDVGNESHYVAVPPLAQVSHTMDPLQAGRKLSGKSGLKGYGFAGC